MLYSIGYQNLKDVEALKNILQAKGVRILVDVRSKPYSRWKPIFNKKNLAAELQAAGIAYNWKGDRLGGFSKISETDIAGLAGWQQGKIVCLMCMEADHNKCHRHYEIAKRLKKYGVMVEHL